ncbi:TPA: exonuclease SbcCD subunit D [Candidatus Woesearchaeota archaeon]|nr:DNA double-strand break repair protein Mre11 [archaeon GW2011_AR15]MBS3103676.1 exonuclease SbcCD subunit D [Candidatus Woesearchaeota archaeon]HIH41722.1 exonuclease SbcCD subunit D [Candidatus Woesearchaeota archaeon]
MKFSHIADCHIGGWRDPKLKDLNTQAFFRALDISLKEKVDFIVIGGDLFNTALPGIDRLKDVVRKFRELKEKNVPVYLIPGSHDFSPSGKTMLDVLEEAGLCTNVVKGSVENNKLKLKFTIDEKTGAKITGMLGRRGMLERTYYEELDRASLEKEPGFKIFLFHTAITELKPKDMDRMDSAPISLLPKGFDYYAGGHVHIVEKLDMPGYRNVVYPGPLFPNNFHELEELKGGGFYIYDNGEVKRHEIAIKKVVSIRVDALHKNSEKVTEELLDKVKRDAEEDCIILIRISGVLQSGRVSDIDFKKVYDILAKKDVYFVMRNTSGLATKEFEEVKIETRSAEEIEDRLIEEHLGQRDAAGWGKEKERKMIKDLMVVLSSDKKEGEKVYEFEARIKDELNKLLEID